jgi:hypothetical protein
MRLRFNLRQWRRPIFWTVLGLVLLEFPLIVATLALFGIADPDTYRTKLWQDGFRNGFNSDPTTQLYAAANYLPIPSTPLVWSQFLTKYNLIISILSMFILLLKAVLVPMHVLFPIISSIIHAVEVGLWSYSVSGQTSPDTIDPVYKNPGPPWYITKSCNVASKKENIGFCKQEKASFYVTVVMLTLYCAQLLLAIFSMFFAPVPLATDSDSEKSTGKGRMTEVPEREWEMVRIPDTPGTTGGIKSPMNPMNPMNPMTPRTTAFHALGGGEEDYSAPQAVEPPLPAWGLRREEKMPWSNR